MDPTDFTVASITVTYNSSKVIDRHLASIGKLEGLDSIAIIDNGSVDGTRTKVDDFATVHTDHEVLVWEPAENLGFGAANNLAADKLDTDLLLVINPDVFIDDPQLLTEARAEFTEPEVAAVGCALYRQDGTLDHACKRGEPTLMAALTYYLRLDRLARWFPRTGRYRAAHVGASEVADVEAINGAFMLIRRSVFEAVGGFDERYWMYAEDLDLCRMIRLAGGRIVYRGDLEATHLKAASTDGGPTPESAQAFHQSSLLYYEKWYGPESLPTQLVSALVWSRLAIGRLRPWCLRLLGER